LADAVHQLLPLTAVDDCQGGWEAALPAEGGCPAQLGEPCLNQRFEPPELRLLQLILESELLEAPEVASNGGRARNKRLQVFFLPREQVTFLPDFRVSEIPQQVRKLDSQVVVMLALPGGSREVLGAPEGRAPYDAQDYQRGRSRG